MPTTSRLSKAAGHLPELVVRPAHTQRATRLNSRPAHRVARLAYIVGYALLPLVIALVAMAMFTDWDATPAHNDTSTHIVPAAISAVGTTQARARSVEAERPGNPGAERTGDTAPTPLSSPLGSR